MKRLLCCWWLLFTTMCFAQKEKFNDYRTAFGYNPLSLIKADQMLMFGLEHKLKPKLSLVLDAGWVIHSTYLQEEHKVVGFEVRPAVRYYHSRNRRGGYIQGALQYRLTNYNVYGWLGKNCVTGVPAYERLQHFTFRKQMVGFAFIAGRVDNLSRRWLLDISAGLGAQYRTQKLVDEPNACFEPQDNLFSTVERDNMWIPAVPLSVKICYLLK